MLRVAVALALIVAVLSVGSYATSVTVTQMSVASSSGTLTYVYFESAAAAAGTSPAVNTALSQPSGTGSTTINRGGTDSLWSIKFANAWTIAAGFWVVDIWAAGASKGSMTVSIYITNPAGVVQTTIANGVSTPSISNTKNQVAFTVGGAAASIPANGYIEVSFTAPTGPGNPTSFTMYWGKAQGTNFQVPMAVVNS